MKVLNREQGGHFSIQLDDVFDFKHVEEFRKCYESIDGSRCRIVAIDFSSTRYMDSSALGMLLNIKNFFKDGGVQVKIVNTNEQIRKILSISRFDQRFTIE